MGFWDTIRANVLRSACANLPPEQIAASVVDAIASRPDAVQLSDALMVRLANNGPIPVTMYGRQVVDTLPGANPRQRLSYEVQPFAHMSAGAGCVVIASDGKGEEYVLLGQRSDDTGWGLPAGYMNVKPSFNAQGIYSENIGHKRDAFEGDLARNGARTAREPINGLTGKPPAYDKTLEDTAVRETWEETGLVIRKEQLQFVGEVMRDNSSKLNPSQNETHYYLVDLRADKTLPPLLPKDDLKDTQWVKLSDIKNENNNILLRGIPVVDGIAIEKAIGQMREKEYAGFGVTKDAISNYSHLPIPSSEMGEAGLAWHKNALSIAASMKEQLQKMEKGKSAGYGLSI